jgi:outer membrane protein assembly factor BamB
VRGVLLSCLLPILLLVLAASCALRTQGVYQSDTGPEDPPAEDGTVHPDEDGVDEGDEPPDEPVDPPSDDPPPEDDGAAEPDGEADAPEEEEEIEVCIDLDGDLLGEGCPAGPDCDDTIRHCGADCSDGNANGLPDCAETTWLRTINHGTYYEAAHAALATPDDGVLLAGMSSADFWTLRLDGGGEVLWQSYLRGAFVNVARSLVPVIPGDHVILAGYTSSYGMGGYDLWLVELDAGGVAVRQGTVGGSGDDFALSACNTSDGMMAVTGSTTTGATTMSPDVLLIKLQTTGTLQWQAALGGSYTDEGRSIIETSDGSYVVAGMTGTAGLSSKALIVKLDRTGTVVWQKAFGSGTVQAEASDVVESADGNLVVAGFVEELLDRQVLVMKLDGSGGVLWTRSIGTVAPEEGFALHACADGGVLVAGKIEETFDGSMLLFKMDADGVILWQKVIDIAGSVDAAYALEELPSGDIIVAGGGGETENSDLVVARLLADGRFMGTCPEVTDGAAAASDAVLTAANPALTLRVTMLSAMATIQSAEAHLFTNSRLCPPP